MKRVLITLAVTGLLSIGASAYAQQRYSPPGGKTNPGGGNKTTTGGGNKTTTGPKQSTPDPVGLTLAFSGAAAAVGYVMRRRRGEA